MCGRAEKSKEHAEERDRKKRKKRAPLMEHVRPPPPLAPLYIIKSLPLAHPQRILCPGQPGEWVGWVGRGWKVPESDGREKNQPNSLHAPSRPIQILIPISHLSSLLFIRSSTSTPSWSAPRTRPP